VTPRLPALLPWLAGLIAVYLVVPFIAAIPQVWLADWRSVDMAALGRATAVSVGSATFATALIALGGIPLGYLLARCLAAPRPRSDSSSSFLWRCPR